MYMVQFFLLLNLYGVSSFVRVWFVVCFVYVVSLHLLRSLFVAGYACSTVLLHLPYLSLVTSVFISHFSRFLCHSVAPDPCTPPVPPKPHRDALAFKFCPKTPQLLT